jgi:hypothetical protein
MKKFALAMAAAATLAFTAPAFAASTTPDRIQLAQADVTVKKVTRSDGVRKKVVIRHRGDTVRRKVVIRDRHHGWRHHGWRHRNVMKKTVIKHRPNGTVVKKTVIR